MPLTHIYDIFLSDVCFAEVFFLFLELHKLFLNASLVFTVWTLSYYWLLWLSVSILLLLLPTSALANQSNASLLVQQCGNVRSKIKNSGVLQRLNQHCVNLFCSGLDAMDIQLRVKYQRSGFYSIRGIYAREFWTVSYNHHSSQIFKGSPWINGLATISGTLLNKSTNFIFR